MLVLNFQSWAGHLGRLVGIKYLSKSMPLSWLGVFKSVSLHWLPDCTAIIKLGQDVTHLYFDHRQTDTAF